MPFYTDVDIYGRAPKDPKLHARNLFLRYKDVYDLERLRDDRENYRKLLSLVAQVMKGYNFRQNVLIICDEMLHKEIFYYALGSMPQYLSYHNINANRLSDIWWGNEYGKEDGFNSEQELNRRILCLYGDKSFWINSAVGQIINTIISSRASGNGRENLSQYTWIFYRGKKDNMTKMYANDKVCGWQYVLDLFNTEGEGFDVIDLNAEQPDFVKKAREFNIAWKEKKIGIDKEKNPNLIVRSSNPIIGAPGTTSSLDPKLDY